MSQTCNDIVATHLQSGKQHVFHASRVSPYIGTTISAKNIGLIDSEEYVVELISSHRGSWKRLSDMEFLVQWTGYSPDESTWEPWRNLKHLGALHEYMKKNKRANHLSAATTSL